MGKISYLFSDYLKDLIAASISLTNEDSNYPTENSQTEEIAETTRTTDKVNILYQMDLGSVKQPQIFFIGNHNLTSGSVKVYSYSAANFSDDQKLEATFTYRAMDMYVRLSVAPSPVRQYWEFDFSKNGNAASADSYFEFGRTMLYDDLVQLTDIEDFEQPRIFGFKNIINETEYGVRYVHKLVKEREEFELTWRIRTQANMPAELRTLFSAIYGDAHPFLFIPDLSNTDCYYVFSKLPNLEWVEIFGKDASSLVSGLRLSLIEAVRGKA